MWKFKSGYYQIIYYKMIEQFGRTISSIYQRFFQSVFVC